MRPRGHTEKSESGVAPGICPSRVQGRPGVRECVHAPTTISQKVKWAGAASKYESRKGKKGSRSDREERKGGLRGPPKKAAAAAHISRSRQRPGPPATYIREGKGKSKARGSRRGQRQSLIRNAID